MSNPTELPDLPKPFGIIDIYDDAGSYMGCRDGFTADQMRGYLLDYAVKLGLAQPEGEAPQADAIYQVATKQGFAWCDVVKEVYDDCPSKTDFNRRIVYTRPAATLSPLCGAQHAESGKEKHSFTAYVLDCKAHGTVPMTRSDFAAQQAAAPGLAKPELMRQAVASVVSRAGDDLRIAWLRPERCDVGTLLYCAVEQAALSDPGTPEAPDSDDLLEAVARAIWNIRREEEDRCDMELEDMGDGHPVWDEAEAAIEAIQRAAQLDGDQEGSAT